MSTKKFYNPNKTPFMCMAIEAPNIQSRAPSRKYNPISTIAAFTQNINMSGKYFTTTKHIANNPIKLNILPSFCFLLYS